MDIEKLKRDAAARALDEVRPGMRLGIGTGSTMRHFVELLGDRVRDGLDVEGVPTSEATAAQARALGIRLITLDEAPVLDLAIDGADEIDPALDLIKGGGGALLREKIVAAASAGLIVIADETKWVPVLGRFPLPIEVIPFGLGATLRAIEKAFAASGTGGKTTRRQRPDGHPFVTDGGHWIVDAALGQIPDPKRLAASLSSIPGVVEHGLFIGMTKTAILAGPSGIRV
ncbi:MAG: ribose-5-phosphate isomerase RpiA, partial [Pseudorhodoplanes sp.]